MREIENLKKEEMNSQGIREAAPSLRRGSSTLFST